jgi:hypothetical protein
MIIAVNSEADEKDLMLEWPNGVAQRSDQGGLRYPLGEQGRRTPGQVPNGGWTGACRGRTGARRRARWVLDRGQVSGGGPTASLGGGPTGEYISAAGPHFWALSSSAQSHLQEMWVRRVLMSESSPLRGEFQKKCSPPQCFYD